MDGGLSALPVWTWFAIGASAFVGSLMFSFVRPHPTPWKGASIVATSTGSGVVLTLGTCHWFGVTQETQFMVVAFIIGLLIMPIVSAAVKVTEDDARSWVKGFVGRVFGHQEPKTPPALDSSDDGSDK